MASERLGSESRRSWMMAPWAECKWRTGPEHAVAEEGVHTRTIQTNTHTHTHACTLHMCVLYGSRQTEAHMDIRWIGPMG